MNIKFEQLEMLNFMSFKEQSFDFSSNNGINLICGVNNDIPDSKNGCGKCLDKKTLMKIEVDEEIYEKIMKFIKS